MLDDGNPLLRRNDEVKESHIDWGLAAGQVSAEDVPIRDTAGDFTATQIEGALAEIHSYAFASERTCEVSSTYSGDDTAKQRFTTVQAAINYANSQTPTSTTRWLIKIHPGVYDEQLTLYDYVHFRGDDTATCRIENALSIMTISSHETSFHNLTFAATGTAEIFNVTMAAPGSPIDFRECDVLGNGSANNIVSVGNNGSWVVSGCRIRNGTLAVFAQGNHATAFTILSRTDITGNITVNGGTLVALSSSVTGQSVANNAAELTSVGCSYENLTGDAVVMNSTGAFSSFNNIFTTQGATGPSFYSLRVTAQPVSGSSSGNIYRYKGATVPDYSIFATVPFLFGGYGNAYQRGFNSNARNVNTTVRLVAPQWGEYPTISAAVAAAVAGDTVVIAGGTYTESVTVSVNNLILKAQNDEKVVITQADATVLDWGATTGGVLQGVTVTLTAPTAYRAMITNAATGSVSLVLCTLQCTQTASFTGAQTRGIYASGSVVLLLCNLIYTNTGVAAVGDYKTMLYSDGGGMGRIDAITCQAFITCSGTAAGSAFGIDAGGGVLAIRRSNITVTDSTGAASGLIFTGTSVLDESYFNEFTVTSAGAGHAIGIDAQDTVTVRCSSNVIKCTAPGAGNAYAYQIATGATLTATFDETIAAERFNPIGAATFEYILSESDGQLTVSRTFVTNEKGMEMCPSDRTWTAADPVNGIDYKKTYTIATGSVGGLIAFSGTAQWSVAGGALGAGNLFKNEGTFKNVPGTNNSFGSQYTFVNTAKYESDNGIISSLFNRIVLLQPTFRGINGGTLSITSDAAGVYYNPIVDTGATITNLRGINFPGGTINGTVTNYHYLNMSNFPGAGSANYRAINSAVNTPNWFLYHTGTALSRLDGGLQVGQRLTLTGFHNYTSTSPAQITSNQNNYALPSGTNSRFKVRLSTDASRTVTGIVPQTSGDAIYIINIGANDLVLAHQSGSSTAANRMISPTGADLTLGADEYAYLWYDDVTTRWRILESNGA